MQDVTVLLEDAPGALARMGEALGAAGVSIEGGGAFTIQGRSEGHYLFHDGEAARVVLEAAGMTVLAVRPVLLTRLEQALPGSLGRFCRDLADRGVNIVVQYSDHANRLVLVTEPGRP